MAAVATTTAASAAATAANTNKSGWVQTMAGEHKQWQANNGRGVQTKVGRRNECERGYGSANKGRQLVGR